MHNFVYYSYQISFLLCFSIYKKNKTQSPFPLQISHIWWNGIYVTLKSRTLWAPPYFNLLQSPSSLRLKVVFCSPSSTFPLQNEWHRCRWTRQYPLDSFPSLFAQHEVHKLVFWSLFLPQPLPPLRADRHRERREMGRPRATKSEGRRHRSDKPCLRIMKKQVVELFSQSKKLTEQDILWLWTIKVEILVLFEGMDGA